MPANKAKPASPFAGIVGESPKDIARDAERVLDSPYREEVADAQAVKAKSTATAKTGGDQDEVVSINVRNPLSR